MEGVRVRVRRKGMVDGGERREDEERKQKRKVEGKRSRGLGRSLRHRGAQAHNGDRVAPPRHAGRG